jgi:hypothetical protein
MNRIERELSDFTGKGQTVNISGFSAHMVFVTVIQLCHDSVKPVIEDTETDEYGEVPIKLYLCRLKFDFHVSQNSICWIKKSTHTDIKIVLSLHTMQNSSAQVWPVVCL